MRRVNRRTPEEVAEAIAYICENIGQIRATLRCLPADGPRQFEKLLIALRDGEDPVELLDVVHRALRQAQDASGVFGRTRDVSMAKLFISQPREPVLLCPRGGHPCARYAAPAPGGTPVCEITGAPLRRTTLTP